MFDIILNVFSICMFSSVLKTCKKEGINDWHKKASIVGIGISFVLLLVNIYLLLN